VLASAVFILALVVVVTVQVSGAAKARRLAKMN
jgi:spermidine/putrescine transport system permease protein